MRRPAGFTLIELLVVLAIGVGLGALAAPSFARLAERVALERDARELAASLRAARNRAIAERREVVVATSPRTESQSVRFFTDGSSSGATLVLASGPRRRVVEVSWLTGRVSVHE